MGYGKKLEAIRKATGLTIEKFVVMVGISYRGYFYIVQGEGKPRTLTARRIDELAKEYGVKDNDHK